MAAERGDERLAPLLTGPQPAVLRLVKATVEAAAAHGRWVGVCGELAGDPAAAVLFAGLGRDRAEHGAGARARGQGGAAGGRRRAGPGRRRGGDRDRQRRPPPARSAAALAVTAEPSGNLIPRGSRYVELVALIADARSWHGAEGRAVPGGDGAGAGPLVHRRRDRVRGRRRAPTGSTAGWPAAGA